MPARRAIASVDAPCTPCRANSCRAASSTASRRSSAVCLVLVAMVSKLSLTHISCQDRADAMDLVLGRRRREGKREGPFVHAIRSRKGALIAIGVEAMERIRADLSFDPRRTQTGESL